MSLNNLKIILHFAWIITFVILALALRDTLAGPAFKVLLVLTALNAIRLSGKRSEQTGVGQPGAAEIGQATH
ncbi:MAG: hypothetical protein RI973_1255 [Bacteroidota bacterium]|jgi:hypothetical protein